jgi:serine O-acetyltransferase
MITEEFVDELYKAHFDCSITRQLKPRTEKVLEQVLEILFPQLAASRYPAKGLLIRALTDLQRLLAHIIAEFPAIAADKESISSDAIRELPHLRATLQEDIQAIYTGDPAAISHDEVILAYPGFFAIATYRFARIFYKRGATLFARVLTEIAHSRTGIDIHPGADIGRAFCIDHGTGIVIGETTTIGDNVKVYQGVTLGALSVEKQFAGQKRHPSIENGVVIYANATILGGETVIGTNSVIGGNVWLTHSVPPGTKVYHQAEVEIRHS